MKIIINDVDYTLDTNTMPIAGIITASQSQPKPQYIDIPIIRWMSGKPDMHTIYQRRDNLIEFDGEQYNIPADDIKEFERFKRNLFTWYELNYLENIR